MENDSVSVGQRVRSLRQQRGWTARRLAQECARAGMPSLTRGTVAKIESGVRKSVTVDELVALASAFDVAVSELLPAQVTSAPSPPPADPARPLLKRPAPTAEPGPYFFLSYAHTPKHDPTDPDDPDAWVGTLYTDLCRHIMQLTDLPRGASPGFMDRELRPGGTWPATLSQALATCRVFVPLYSHRYFESEQCGKEWYAFARRVLDNEAKSPRRTDAIIPAIWVPVGAEEMPQAARSVQFAAHDLGDTYGAHGFYGIMKLSRYRDAYEEAVYELARRIVVVAREEPVQPGKLEDYATLESAFGLYRHGTRLRLTVVAPYSANLPPGRGDYHYGHSALDWNPYRPDSLYSLAEHASDLVRNLDYRPDIGGLEERRTELTSDSPPVAPEVILVDPWAAAQPESAQILRRFDMLAKPWVQVIVPWNRADTETADATSRLRDSLNESLHNKLAEGRATSMMAVTGVPSLEAFSAVLPAIVRTAVRQYLKHATAHPPAGPAMEKPRLRSTTDVERAPD